MLKLLILTSFVSLTYGNICCVPRQWEATEGLLTGSIDDEGHTAVTYGTIGYTHDDINQRTFSASRLTVGNDSRIYSILQFSKQNVTYIIENNVCVKTHAQPWHSFCVPDNATVIGRYTLGHMNQLAVTEYNTTQGGGIFTVAVTDQCVPVMLKIYGNIRKESNMVFYGIQNFTLGIADPHIFDVPTICPKIHEGQPMQHLRKQRSVLKDLLYPFVAL